MRSAIALTLMSLLTILGDLQGYEGKPWDRTGLQEYAKDVQKRKGWVQASEGFFNDRLENISVAFKSFQALELEEARRLFVPEVQKAIAILHDKQNQSILQANGPFGPANLTFSLAFQQSDCEYYAPPFIALVIFANEKISYETRNANGVGFCEIHEESFEEAIDIINRETTQKTHASPGPKNSRFFVMYLTTGTGLLASEAEARINDVHQDMDGITMVSPVYPTCGATRDMLDRGLSMLGVNTALSEISDKALSASLNLARKRGGCVITTDNSKRGWVKHKAYDKLDKETKALVYSITNGSSKFETDRDLAGISNLLYTDEYGSPNEKRLTSSNKLSSSHHNFKLYKTEIVREARTAMKKLSNKTRG